MQRIERLRLVIRGAVQGVGFRPFVYRLAVELELQGWVGNSAGGVTVEVEGDSAQHELFRRRLAAEKPANASIYSLEIVHLDPAGYSGFQIKESSGGPKTTIILPDI
ncbi:MAG: carbamoyltransferase HypF, partial [Acidobacteria bacterium]